MSPRDNTLAMGLAWAALAVVLAFTVWPDLPSLVLEHADEVFGYGIAAFLLGGFIWKILRTAPDIVSDALAEDRHGIPWYTAIWRLGTTLLAVAFWVCFALAILYLFVGGITATLTG